MMMMMIKFFLFCCVVVTAPAVVLLLLLFAAFVVLFLLLLLLCWRCSWWYCNHCCCVVAATLLLLLTVVLSVRKLGLLLCRPILITISPDPFSLLSLSCLLPLPSLSPPASHFRRTPVPSPHSLPTTCFFSSSCPSPCVHAPPLQRHTD